MRSSIKPVFFLGFVIALTSCTPTEKENPFGDLSRIEGDWKMSGSDDPENDFLLESWRKVNDTLYIGKSYEVIKNDSTLTETIQLVATAGEIFYIPTVTNQNDGQPVSFKLIKKEGNTFIFDNPEHDFPTTISYELKSDHEMNASIAGTIKGEPRSMEFYYKKESN